MPRRVNKLGKRGTSANYCKLLKVDVPSGAPVGEFYDFGGINSTGLAWLLAMTARVSDWQFDLDATINEWSAPFTTPGAGAPLPYSYTTAGGNGLTAGQEHFLPAFGFVNGFESFQVDSPQEVLYLGGAGANFVDTFTGDGGTLYFRLQFHMVMGYDTTDPNRTGFYYNGYTTLEQEAIDGSADSTDPGTGYPLTGGGYGQCGYLKFQVETGLAPPDNGLMTFATPIYGWTSPTTGEGDSQPCPMICDILIKPPATNGYFPWGDVIDSHTGELLIVPRPMRV
ncbi:MAG: hypothetical protein QOE70_4390 [Chthoniobacter sp.]|jgi:hypothetical protein|nr:hypothetical protein [Chthoniobacter sp.]